MPTQRAGYTVTMFLVDVSPSMGQTRVIDLPSGPNDQIRTREITKLNWVLEFVMLKVQEMIFHGRKTDQCGVILFGTEETDNTVNKSAADGYEHVTEFIPIGQPNAQTLAKIKSIKPSTEVGDPIDALIVGIETQAKYLGKKATWTRKMALLTDGENPMELEDWDVTAQKMNDLEIQTFIVGVDFDDENMPFVEENKSDIKRINETFYRQFSKTLNECVVGTAAYALQECSKPDIKMTKSTLMNSSLRIGDVESRPEEAIELRIKTSKCTAISRPPSMKKYAKRIMQIDTMDVDGANEYTLLDKKTDYVVERYTGDQEDAGLEDDGAPDDIEIETVEKEKLVRGYKYGASFVPIGEEEEFERLESKIGIDICGFFYAENYRREWSIGEVQYVWANPESAREQVAFSSVVQAMFEKGAMAIARWAGRGDPKMGVLMPRVLDDVDCFLWVQVPFADDIRKYTFRSLDHLISKKGEEVKKHAHLPTEQQLKAMDAFVDAMDLMHVGEKDEEGNRLPWFDPVQTYNPAIHRIKQALFHGAITSDLLKNPLPPPHPDLTMYFEPPPKVSKRARSAIEECKGEFKVKQASPKKTRGRKDAHVAGEEDDEDDLIDLGKPVPRPEIKHPSSPIKGIPKTMADMGEDSGTEDEDIIALPPVVKDVKPHVKTPSPEAQRAVLPTPARSLGPISPSPEPTRTSGRIIGNRSPLEDFRRNIKSGDVVSQAVRDLGAVIKEIVVKPFASRRHNEMMECLKEMRDVALQEDEINIWNIFIRDLKEACLNHTPDNKEFWGEIQKVGRPLSLISSKEAKKFGGKSDVTEGTAVDFVEEDED